MRRSAVPVIVFVLALIGIALAYAVYLSSIAPRLVHNHKILVSDSDIRLAFTIDYARGPLVQERWTMRDLNGTSTLGYRATGRNNVEIAIDESPTHDLDADSDVAFLFGKVVQDGLWDLYPKRPRLGANEHYTISVYQLIDGQHGGRTFSFTDPHYWATTGGHQFTIHLDKDKPVPDLLKLSSTTLVEPRYEELVADFRAFGPASFRARIASEKKRRYGVTS
jgi:hypothetical protein